MKTYRVRASVIRDGASSDGPEIAMVEAASLAAARSKIERRLKYGVGSIVEVEPGHVDLVPLDEWTPADDAP